MKQEIHARFTLIIKKFKTKYEIFKNKYKMNTLKAIFVLIIFLVFGRCRKLNKNKLVQQYSYSIDYSLIDLNGLANHTTNNKKIWIEMP